MLKTFLILSLLAAVAICVPAEDLQKKNELKDTEDDKLEILMSSVDQHCKAISSKGPRQKRQADDRLAGIMRQVIRNNCDGQGDVNPTSEPVQAAVTTPSIHGPCTSPNTVNLTGSWRKDKLGSRLKPASGFYGCDRTLQRGQTWFRFTGSAGVKLADSCRPDYSCGGHGGFWSNATMPTQVGEIRRVPIYGSWRSNCNWYTWPVQNPLIVQRCSDAPDDFVYLAQGTGSCYWTFCGMDGLPN